MLRITDLVRREIIKDYKSGSNAKNISKAFAIHERTVYNIIKEAGVHRCRCGSVGKRIDWQKIAASYAEQILELKEIARAARALDSMMYGMQKNKDVYRTDLCGCRIDLHNRLKEWEGRGCGEDLPRLGSLI